MTEEILSPDKQLRNLKLAAYFGLLEEFNKYRRLRIYRNANYPKTNWITSLIAFYDAMFTEVCEEQFKENYGKLFEEIKKLDYKISVSYDELINYTREMMKFADATGITKISKHEESDTPGGARYE